MRAAFAFLSTMFLAALLATFCSCSKEQDQSNALRLDTVSSYVRTPEDRFYQLNAEAVYLDKFGEYHEALGKEKEQLLLAQYLDKKAVNVADIAVKMNDFQLAGSYRQQALELYTSSIEEQLDTQIHELEKKYDLSEAENWALKSENRFRFILFLTIFGFIFTVISIFHHRQQHAFARLEQEKKDEEVRRVKAEKLQAEAESQLSREQFHLYTSQQMKHNMEKRAMKQPVLFVLSCIMITTGLQGQQLQGIIVNSNGEPIPNSTVYIHEIAKGIVADHLGEFQTTLEPGTYTCEFRSLGYESIHQRVEMGEGEQAIRVVLQEKTYMLQEVVVRPTSSNEDPAYRIMRNAIARAPYYRYQVKEYTSEAYIKGSLTIDKIPGILKRATKVNDSSFDLNTLIGKPLVMESKSEIHFTSPETYTQDVTALKSSIPEQFNATKGLSIMTSSIYNAELSGRVSPLAPGAFRFYDFKLESVDHTPDHIINKIKVIPRKKNPNLFSGHLYILEDTWNVYIADLVASELGTTMHYRINYHRIQHSVYLPTTYDVTLTMNTMGVKGSGNYYASVKYNSVRVDENQKSLATAATGSIQEPVEKNRSPKQQKAADELDKLAQKEELSTREAYKMSKLMSQMVEPEEVKEQRESLEIKEIEKVKMKVDTLAWNRDSTFWARIREVPLRKEELISYRAKDSLSGNEPGVDKEENRDEVVLSIDENPKKLFGKITRGGIWKVNPDLSLRYGGLMGVLKEYNFTDGFWLGQALSLSYAPGKNRSLSFSPSLYYATAREEWLWHISSSLNYAPLSLGRLDLSAGHISRDVNSLNGESRLMNTLTAIGLGQNYIRFYDSRYIKATHSIDIANGLRGHTGGEIDKRSVLSNHTSFNFIGEEVPENIPSDPALYPGHTAANLTLQLSYTPRYRYRVREGKKWYVSSKYPTFSAAYKKGVNLFADNPAPLYDKFVLSASQNIKVSPFEEIDYLFSGGAFLSSDRVYPNDLHYFRNNQMLFTASEFNRSFNLLEPYTASGKWWMEGHLNFQSQYLLLKNLPFLQRFSFDEAVHLHGLSTENRKFYLEGGYSVGFLGLGRAGIFTGFTDKKIDRFGVRISYPLWNIIEKPLK